MKNLRSWLLFTFCVLLALTAMAWVTHTVLDLEHIERKAQQQAVSEENTRLALWRMDSQLSALIANESAQPYLAYQAFYPAKIAFTPTLKRLQEGSVLMPSALLLQKNPLIRLHFQRHPDGQISSPQLPTGPLCDLAAHQFGCAPLLEEAANTLAQLTPLLAQQNPLPELKRTLAFQPTRESTLSDQTSLDQGYNPGSNYSPSSQQKRSRSELEARTLNSWNSQSGQTQQDLAEPKIKQNNVTQSTVKESAMHALWFEEELFLLRHVTIKDQDWLQGAWLDWPTIQTQLLASIQDLWPGATLKKAINPPHNRQLASLPVELLTGPPPPEPGATSSPRRWILALAWACCLIAALALAILLHGVLSLSERRGAFVSAVTHELRTPLTTFKLYTEMLTSGMVLNEGKRTRYLQTLKREADRLGHLVNNVLAYSRLEARGSEASRSPITVSELLSRTSGNLQEIAARAPITLDVKDPGALSGQIIVTDLPLVEQILINLIDNACKYARTAPDPRVELSVAQEQGQKIALIIRDNGPGITPGDHRRIFRAFFKSAQEAAHSAPGVGLGLALSRQLARRLGGDLIVLPDGPGATFQLTLPLGDES